MVSEKLFTFDPRFLKLLYTAVIILMLLSIWALGILGPILVSLVLEGIAWWLKKRENKIKTKFESK